MMDTPDLPGKKSQTFHFKPRQLGRDSGIIWKARTAHGTLVQANQIRKGIAKGIRLFMNYYFVKHWFSKGLANAVSAKHELCNWLQ